MTRLSQSFRAIVEYIDLGEPVENATHVSLSNVFNAIQFQLTGEIARHGATVMIDPNLPIVQGHRKRIERMFFEILKNAVMYGAPEVEPHIVRISSNFDQHTTFIAIEDCGPGLPTTMSSYAFQPFSRGFGDLTDEQTGVGLALAHRIAEGHRWGLTLQERKNRFRVVVAIPPLTSVEQNGHPLQEGKK